MFALVSILASSTHIHFLRPYRTVILSLISTTIISMLKHGSLAVAVVHRQVMIVQAARMHGQYERWIDVYTYAPFGERIFLASPVPQARIASRDILAIFPTEDTTYHPLPGMLELTPKAFAEYVELSSRTQKHHEQLFTSWSSKVRRRWLVL